MPRYLLASRNPKKVAELHRVLLATDALATAGIDVVGLDQVPPYPEVPETGLTFADNALLKAREGGRYSGLPTIADDSGIAVDVLGGMPGVFSARWAGRHGDDRANLELLLAQIDDVPDEHLGAAFVCAAALVGPDGLERVVHGEMRGRLVRKPRGTNGFGYDPIFVPEGQTRTCAEMEPQEKDAISHRGRAFRALAALLTTL
jgi:XTP/dITP diphosphohydrolase